ncbi:hypothetical protein [Flavobacterium dankookense]|uniref:Uncharacterized protein n=1 Tax=Flavobacterium dankookense TaxID=706186 RepID=A0A4R6Q5Z4_9FLAO|nr:hypothetical protein [Flavobacterium dankookense]TDP57838.1 hypothetical protein BC748_2657 [Flavobacterium dankookense]
MKRFLLLIILFVYNLTVAQNINDYKYVIVPAKFDAFKEPNKYNLNVNTKLLLQKYGFEVFMIDDELPTEIADSRCKALFADVIEEKALMISKLKIVLKDCKDKVVYETAVGKSREKDFKVSYNLAFRDAAKSFETLNYKYNGGNEIAVTTEEKQEPKEESKIYSLETNPENSEIFFFAQPITNGFQIVNSEPRVIMRLFNTSQKGVFIAIRGDEKGIVITKNGKWFFENYVDGKLLSEPINIRF